MRENRPSGSEGGVAFGPSLPLSGPFVNPPWGVRGESDRSDRSELSDGSA